ncbi:hypothetical protein ACFXKC_40920 [Streptomyces sp. NPDC059340]|uniref:hypothetical protein n=1 Tax=Streptomyces sp. NPDC059340 TaxID=3346806 RepID=UPI0036C4F45D
MTSWLAATWDQTWPNLLANVLWVPAVWIHHQVMTRHIRALRQHVTALHAQQEQLIVRHVIGAAAGPEQEGAA